MRALELSELILFSIFSVCLSTEPIGTGGPSVVPEGGDALLTCVVMNPYANETVIWRKGPNEILSAGKNRVTGDKRISILHDESKKKKSTNGGEVYVLLIKNVRPDDSDVYGCEVNSDPMLRSFHPLTVKSKSIKSTDNNDTTPTASGSGNSSSSGGPSSSDMDDIIYASEDDNKDGMAPPVTHDFTQCCEALNVSAKCKGFCTVHNIIDGSTGVEPEACEADFPSIVKCMADGRNHVPCCERKKIPDICQDMCQGEYTPFNDYLKSRVSCVAHTLPGLQCILEGIQTLPSEPQAVSVLPLNERSIQISWAPPEKLANTIQNYRINVTRLQTFDEDRLAAENAVFSIRVPAGVNTTTVNDLEPNTMYSITVMSENEHGSSLPSTRIRTLTLENSSKGGPKMTPVNGTTPTIPDVRGCCMKNGVTHRTCLDKMCDPVRADFTEVPDLMVCAPWANITFACLANDIDHTPCCRSRGIPDQCLAFCSGQVHSINFNYFKCLQYMAEYSTCLLEGYGVLPGAPLQLKAKMVSSNFAVIDWKEPKVLSDTVQKYHLHYRRLGSGDEYVVVEKDRAPMILEYMDPTTYYEVFVVAVNMYGRGAPSMRLVFQTKRGYAVDSTPNYNMTNCCISSGVLPQCMILCTYDLKMSDFQASGPVCQQQVSNILRCGAGGRDHSECCSRRGVPATCLGRCRGVVSPATTDCMAFAGNIIQCLEEGTENIPGPVEDLHIVSVGNDSISLAWVPSEGQTNSSKPTDYLVQYGKVNNMTMYETVVKLEHELNTTETEIELGDLDRTSLYRITVVARGVHGQSLPSSMLLVNISQTNKDSTIYGVPSPPHTLTVSGHSATTITVAWHPPEFSHPHEEISYQVFHKNKFNHSIISTRLQWARFAKLTPNTQNIIYIVAVGKMGTSLPSETLVAWTDPALPAFVEPPTIQPSDMIQEGGSMTVLCLALGNPAPTISLYVGGHLVRQDTSRHMVTTIHNITSDMKDVSCYADNGYGVPMQSSKKIRISYPPRLQASGIQVASVGDSVELKCTVKANPEPKMLFWRDHDGRIPVIQGANFDMMISDSDNDPELFTMSLKINKMELQDAGDYFCHATNALGDATRAVSVRIRNSNPVKNITECCIEQNVSSPCLTACSFYIDVQTVIDNPRCLPDFDKLMKCAADGSDHRGCCVQKNVPRKCLNWCRGEPVINGGICTLQYTKTIIGCFQENRERLPGPPIGVEVQVLANNQVKVSWDPPNKNPHTVEGYRVFWYDAEESRDGNISNIINSGGPGRMDTKDLSIILDGLQQHVLYELVVKAGNHYGASVLSDPLRFTLDDHLVTSARHGTHSGVIGGIIAGIIAIILAIVGFMLAKKRKLGHKTVGSNGVAFENPSYLREIHMDRVQITPVSAPVSSAPSAITTNNHSTSSNDYRHEELHAPAAHIAAETEVNPSLIEEFKLGSSNAGFKKLVS